MKLGLENAFGIQTPVRKIWLMIENAMCEPIEWVPAEVWKANGSIMQSLVAGVIDSYVDLLVIDDQRLEVRILSVRSE